MTNLKTLFACSILALPVPGHTDEEIEAFVSALAAHVKKAAEQAPAACKTEHCKGYHQGKLVGLCVAFATAYASQHQIDGAAMADGVGQFSINMCKQYADLTLSFTGEDSDD